MDSGQDAARVVRLSRLYAMSSAINEAILRSSEPLVLYETACRIAVEGGLLMAWVGFVRPHEANFEVVARWGNDSDYLDHVQMSASEGALGNGPSGIALRSGNFSVCNDIAGDHGFAPWREAALRRGYRSSAAFPLKAEGKPVGLFCVYGDRPGYFEQEEVRLLTALADNLSFSIDAHAQRAALRASEQQLERERGRLLEAQSVANIGSWETDLRTFQVIWSPQTHRIFETDPKHFQPTHDLFLQRVHPEDRAEVASTFESSLSHRQPYVVEHRVLTDDGRLKIVEERWQVFSDATGTPERAVGTCFDVTQARLSEAEDSRAAAALADLVDIQRNLAVTARSAIEVKEFICQRAQELTGASGATVEIEDGDSLVYEICSGIAAPHTGLRLPKRASLSGLSVASGSPLYSADSQNDPRVDREGCRRVGIRSMICAPLRQNGQCVGVLKVLSGRSDAFGPRDIYYLGILSETLESILGRLQVAEALRASVDDFRGLAESMPQIVWTTDAVGHCIYLNRLWVDYTGRSLQDSYGDGWTECFHPADLPASRAAWQAARRALGPYSTKFRLRRADGEYRWWLNRGDPLFNQQGELVKWLGTSTDIHDLTVANRALQMLRHCDEALMRAESEPQLLQSICDIAVDLGGYRMAWVGYAADDETKTIEPQAWAGHEDGYLSHLKISWNEHLPEGNGPGGQVIRQGEVIQIPDLDKDPCFAPWIEAARARGYRSLVNLPLRDEQRTFGSFSLFRPELASLSGDELKLLQELADDLAFGLVTLRARAERQRLQDAVVAIARGVSASVGDDFFTQLSKHLVDAVQADAGFIAVYNSPDKTTARTLAALVDGQPAPNFEYPLLGTACEQVLQRPAFVVERGARELFPGGRMMAKLGMDAYAGSSMLNARGESVGLLVVLFRKSLRSSDLLVSTLQIFAARAASEMERQRSDARVREQASLLDKAQDAILVRDLEQRVTYWNQGAERLYGWTAAEAQGRDLVELLGLDPLQAAEAREAVLKNGEWQGELLKYSRQGEPLTLSCRWTLVLDAQGSPQSILSIATDITERKRLKEQFLRAQRMESIGTLAGGIAHDLNNALSPILMSAELLRHQFPDADSQELVDSITSCAERGAEMVRHLLSFARGVEGERATVSVANLLKEVAKIANDTFLKSIQVSFSTQPDLWPVLGDSTQIHQVLMNLCVNARDAMPGGGTLELNAENCLLESGPHLLVQIKDSGSGIAPENVEKIFDPFFTTKEIGQGTGLGLSTSMAIVKSHGGFLQLQSQVQVGSIFEVYLPAQPNQPLLDAPPAVAEMPPGRGELILVVDDEEPVRKVTRRTLESLGYRVLLAADGAEALAAYKENQRDIQVVVTDMMMPVVDGPALIKALRRLDPEVNIIAASGLSQQFPGDQLQLKHLLPKPYKMEALLLALRDLLDVSSQGEEG